MNFEFHERTFCGYLDLNTTDVSKEKPLLYHTIHVKDFLPGSGTTNLGILDWENPFTIRRRSIVKVYRAGKVYEVKGLWTTLNDFQTNFYGPLRLTLNGLILSDRRFLMYHHSRPDGYGTVHYYTGIETDRQFPIYDEYMPFNIENCFLQNTASRCIEPKPDLRIRFIFTSDISLEMVNAFEFVEHSYCTEKDNNCNERNFSENDKKVLFEHLFGIWSTYVLENLGFYKKGNSLFCGADLHFVTPALYHVTQMLALLDKRS